MHGINACLCDCASACPYVYTCGRSEIYMGVFFDHIPSYFLIHGLSLNLDLTYFGRVIPKVYLCPPQLILELQSLIFGPVSYSSAPQLLMESHEPLLTSMRECSLAWSCASLVITNTATFTLWVQWSCISRKHGFNPFFQDLWLLQLFYTLKSLVPEFCERWNDTNVQFVAHLFTVLHCTLPRNEFLH